MKPLHKSIFATVGSVVALSAIVATATCVPAYSNQTGNNLKVLSFEIPPLGTTQPQINLNYNVLGSANVSLKAALLGTNQINDGSYIIYIGSQAYNSNNTFLYGNAFTDVTQFQSQQTMALNGLFGSGLQSFNTLKIKPKVLMFQDVVGPQAFIAKAQFELDIKNWSKDPIFGDSASDQKQKLAIWGTTNQNEINQKRLWATGQSASNWSFDPLATYVNWQGKTVYFRTDSSAEQFRNVILPLVKKHFNNLQTVNTSQGIIIGYKNGKLCSDYSGSFTSTTSSGSNSSSSSSSTAATQSNQFISTYANKDATTLASSSSSTTSSTSNNQFLEWLQYNFGINK